MRRAGAAGLAAGGLIGTVVIGCSGEAPSAAPAPMSVRDADPCSFIEQSVATANGLGQGKTVNEARFRNCWWTAGSFTTAIFVRWDRGVFVDFSDSYPEPLGDVELGGEQVLLGKSRVNAGCAGTIFAENGTSVLVGVAYYPPATADTACERVKTIGGPVVQRLRSLHLLDERPTS
ncbi:hypothetical protein GCM10022222_78050 [Amycolatopsis ultiminotia]|uniref:DUF3558 domain-containing protein n=1 Tax=Amycolatopsis ultiminotia TaxID=543629 RepID=A0ABP6YDP2_9PSEU